MSDWKQVTPIPPEMNGHGFLWYCKRCGYVTAYVGGKKEPPYECQKCNAESQCKSAQVSVTSK